MLNKLQYFQSNDSLDNMRQTEALRRAVLQRFCRFDPESQAIPASLGTLGVCFWLNVGGRQCFLKSHLAGENFRATLNEEANILHHLYGDAILLDRIELPMEGEAPRLGLLMVKLHHLTSSMNADDAVKLVRRCADMLSDYKSEEAISRWSFEQYLECGRLAVTQLSGANLVGYQTGEELIEQINLLDDCLDFLPRALCHGDLSPKNIMTDGSRTIAIDWEDAFAGIVGYDYLYWLTFMANRPFLATDAFGQTGLNRDVERAILGVIVLIKSFLSVRSGTINQHFMPIEARINEVLRLRQ